MPSSVFSVLLVGWPRDQVRVPLLAVAPSGRVPRTMNSPMGSVTVVPEALMPSVVEEAMLAKAAFTAAVSLALKAYWMLGVTEVSLGVAISSRR